MDRRDFMKTAAVAAGSLWLADFRKAYAAGKGSSQVGKVWKGWRKGHFQVHFIYTGVAESMFMIFPDGTTMLLDCGDHNAIGRGKLAVPVLPNSKRHSGEWIARYVRRVNPSDCDVDYMMLSHFHDDHVGNETFFSSKEMYDGKEYFLSGFSEAAKTLHFRTAIDRGWPDYCDPIPKIDDEAGTMLHIRKMYDRLIKEDGLKVEKCVLGSSDQVRMLNSPEKYPSFSVRNICVNGRICAEDGIVTDLYAERIAKQHPKNLNENGMSIGMVFSYGPFRFFTAGDFSDNWKLEDGTHFETENALAEVCGRANVAKVNHHGHYSMPSGLVAALRSQVYVSCVWDQLHNVDPVMERLADRSLYDGDRIICPGIFPSERREEDKGKAWLGSVDEASFEGGHVILDVQPGGEDFSITYLTADDESMIVRSSMNFKTRL